MGVDSGSCADWLDVRGSIAWTKQSQCVFMPMSLAYCDGHVRSSNFSMNSQGCSADCFVIQILMRICVQIYSFKPRFIYCSGII